MGFRDSMAHVRQGYLVVTHNKHTINLTRKCVLKCKWMNEMNKLNEAINYRHIMNGQSTASATSNSEIMQLIQKLMR